MTDPVSEEIGGRVGPVAAKVARDLVGRYTLLYVAVAALIVVGAVMPSKVTAKPTSDLGSLPALASGSFSGSSGASQAASAGSGAVAPAVGAGGSGDGGSSGGDNGAGGSAAGVSGGDLSASSGGVSSGGSSSLPSGSSSTSAVTTAPSSGTSGDTTPAPSDTTNPDDSTPSTGSGGAQAAASCPVNLGPAPTVSNGVAATLLGLASPALSALGPLSTDFVPVLALLSPILPVIAPAADKFGSLLQPLFPVLAQLEQVFGTIWTGPLQPLSVPLVAINQATVLPFEEALVTNLTPAIDQLNNSPMPLCLETLVNTLVAPFPSRGS